MQTQLRSISFLSVLFFTVTIVSAQQDVSLKITYKSQGVCDYEITIKHGDVSLSKSTTDKSGDVSFGSVQLISKSIDVYGYKKTANGDKTFELKGYVALNDSYFYHIKMDEILKDVCSSSGMPENMLLGAWGLNNLDCGVSSGNTGKGAESDQAVSELKSNNDKAEDAIFDQQNSGFSESQLLENEIAALDRKITKNQKEHDELVSDEAAQIDIDILNCELEEQKLKRERKTLALERVEKSKVSALSPAETNDYKTREQAIADQEAEWKANRNELEKSKKESESNGKSGLGNAKDKMEMSSLRTQIKLKEKGIENAKEKGKESNEEIAKRELELEDLKLRLKNLEEGE